MKPSRTRFCHFAVLPLVLCAIWLTPAAAAVAPKIQFLGQIRDGLVAPALVDLDAAGNLYVADLQQKAVVKLSSFGKVVRKYEGVPVSGRGLAVTADGSKIYIAGENSVAILDGVSGEEVGRLGIGEGEFTVAGPMDVDQHGFLFAADCGKLNVRVYDASGKLQYTFGSLGINTGQFRMISTLRLNGSEVHVGDSSTKTPRIQVFGLSGQYLRSLNTSTQFGSPPIGFLKSMTFDAAGRGYFLDFYGSLIKVLGLPSQYLSQFGPIIDPIGGARLGQVNDLAFDPVTSRLFVVCDNQRLDIIGVDGGKNPQPPPNRIPSVPQPLSPIGGSEVAVPAPKLTFTSSIDPDGDLVSYQIQLSRGGVPVTVPVSFQAGEIESSALATLPLVENAQYSWQIQAFDGRDVSGWSGAASFFVNAVQEPPTAPVPVSPLAGEPLKGEDALLWQASADADPGDLCTYRLEVAADAGFAEPLISFTSDALSLALADLPGYMDLKPGSPYFWRVTAVDNHGLESAASVSGSFTLFATDLLVDSNMPGSQVFAGGNLAYPGQFLGETPLKLRGFSPGLWSLVVERAGFEPVVLQVEVAEGTENPVYAELRAALAPNQFDLRTLVGGDKLRSIGTRYAPFLVDYNNDGLIDLLVGGSSGILHFQGELDQKGELIFRAGNQIDANFPAGVTPFVADWNNDGRKDLIVGAADGSVNLYLNAGSDENPLYGEGRPLTAGGVPIGVGSGAAPCVADVDGDHAKDLVVGSFSGAAYLYVNLGTDEAPDLAAPQVVYAGKDPAIPFFADLGAAGARNLILSTGSKFLVFKPWDGTALQFHAEFSLLPGNSGKSGGGSLGLSPRLFVCDLDGSGGKDFILGTESAIRIARGTAETLAASFAAALLDKLDQVEALVLQDGISPAAIASARQALKAGIHADASRELTVLSGTPGITAEAKAAISELMQLIQ